MAGGIKVRTIEDRLQYLEQRSDKMVMLLNGLMYCHKNNCKAHNDELKQIKEELRRVSNG